MLQSFTAVSITNSYAGGSDVLTPPPSEVRGFTPSFYAGIAGGYANSDWKNFIASGLIHNVDNDGFVYGGKLGYQAREHFGLEVGGYVLPRSDFDFKFSNLNFAQIRGVDTKIDGHFNSWIAYAAGTLRASLFGNENLSVYGKIGPVYRSVSHTIKVYDKGYLTGDESRTGHYWTVIFGSGIDYDLAAYHLPVSVGVEYLFVPSNQSFLNLSDVGNDVKEVDGKVLNKNAAPAAHIGVANVSVHFAV